MFAVIGAKRCSGLGARHATRNGGRRSNPPKGASATSPVSGTGNVATNNQDANNTGTNGNTAPPAAPTAKVNVEVFYVHPDHLGTPRVITASTALAATTGTGITSPQTVNKAVWRWDSDPFGSNATANSAPNENPNTLSQVVGTATLPYLFGFDLAFPGQKRDRETGKHYNYFRDYDPSIGRYVESDPIGLKGGINTYGYVGQQPVRLVDPSGLKLCFPWESKCGTCPDSCGCPGGRWIQEFGDFQASIAFGLYLGAANVNVSCSTRPWLKCSARQVCFGGFFGARITAGGSWNVFGTIDGIGSACNLKSGWGDPQLTGGAGWLGGQMGGGGQVGFGPGIGGGGGLITCQIWQVRCNCFCGK